ncbi:MAG: hypothetical protein V4535_05290 [Bacteroidota bacterium]
MKKPYILLLAITIATLYSCSSDTSSEPMLIVKFQFDPSQARLNNLGQPSTVGTGNAAQSPIFNLIGAHYMELAPNANTQLGAGTIIYHGTETTLGGANAIDFNREKIVSPGETFLKIPLSQVAAGSYEWMRVSLAYQNYQISVRAANGNDYNGTLGSFVGFNTYINSFDIDNTTFPVNANKSQGYWAFALNDFPYSTSGQAAAGATTVPNPIQSTSFVPSGSCVVTGRFTNNLVIDGTETNDVVITLSLSINNSFEWHDTVPDGKYQPTANEDVVDMGLRGLVPTYVK